MIKIILLMLVAAAYCYSQPAVGTNVGSTIVPADSTGSEYAATDAIWQRGGWREVLDTAERNAITIYRRREGMFVYCQSDSTMWILQGGIDNSKWAVFNVDSAETAAFFKHGVTTNAILKANSDSTVSASPLSSPNSNMVTNTAAINVISASNPFLALYNTGTINTYGPALRLVNSRAKYGQRQFGINYTKYGADSATSYTVGHIYSQDTSGSGVIYHLSVSTHTGRLTLNDSSIAGDTRAATSVLFNRRAASDSVGIENNGIYKQNTIKQYPGDSIACWKANKLGYVALADIIDTVGYAHNAGDAHNAGYADSTGANAPHGVTADYYGLSNGNNLWKNGLLRHYSGAVSMGANYLNNTGSSSSGIKFDGNNLLTAYYGASGGTPHSLARVIIEDNIDCALQFLTPNTKAQLIFFGDPQSSNSGVIGYYHNSNQMTIQTSGSDRFIVQGNGTISIVTTPPTYDLGAIYTRKGNTIAVSQYTPGGLIDSINGRLPLHGKADSAGTSDSLGHRPASYYIRDTVLTNYTKGHMIVTNLPTNVPSIVYMSIDAGTAYYDAKHLDVTFKCYYDAGGAGFSPSNNAVVTVTSRRDINTQATDSIYVWDRGGAIAVWVNTSYNAGAPYPSSIKLTMWSTNETPVSYSEIKDTVCTVSNPPAIYVYGTSFTYLAKEAWAYYSTPGCLSYVDADSIVTGTQIGYNSSTHTLSIPNKITSPANDNPLDIRKDGADQIWRMGIGDGLNFNTDSGPHIIGVGTNYGGDNDGDLSIYAGEDGNVNIVPDAPGNCYVYNGNFIIDARGLPGEPSDTGLFFSSEGTYNSIIGRNLDSLVITADSIVLDGKLIAEIASINELTVEDTLTVGRAKVWYENDVFKNYLSFSVDTTVGGYVFYAGSELTNDTLLDMNTGYFEVKKTFISREQACFYGVLQIWDSGEINDEFAVFHVPWYINNSLYADTLRAGTTLHAYGGFQRQYVTIPIASANSWAHITNGVSEGSTLWTVVDAEGMTIDNDTMVFSRRAHYDGSLSLSFSAPSEKDFRVRYYNVTTGNTTYSLLISTTGAGNSVTLNTPLYFEVSAGDRVVAQITCTTDGTDPLLTDAIFVLKYLHE